MSLNHLANDDYKLFVAYVDYHFPLAASVGIFQRLNEKHLGVPFADSGADVALRRLVHRVIEQ